MEECRGYKGERAVGVKMVFTHYKEHLAPVWSEHDPSLRVFLDSSFNRDPVEFKLDPNNPRASYVIDIGGTLKDSSLSNTAAIGLKGYVTSSTDTGIPCRVSAGSDFIYLKDVLTHLETNKTFKKTIELRLHSVKNYEKGKIDVTISKENFHVGREVKFVKVKAMENCYVNGKYDSAVASKKVLAYIGETLKAKSELKEKDPRTRRIRAPVYLGDPGLELTNGAPLPASAFVMYEIPKSNALFWENTVRVVMAREGWEPRDWKHLSREEQNEVFKATVCYVAQYMPYIGDTIDRNTRHARYKKALKSGCENFEGGLEKMAGDCEDLGQAILACVDALRAAAIEDNASVSLKGVKELSHQYIAAMSLDSVTSAAVTGANDTTSALGAHMNINLIPATYFKECLERNNPDVSNELPWGKIKMGDGKNLVKVAEGTGIYYSERHVQDNRYVASYLYRERCFSTFKKPIFHEQGTHSPFYRSGLTLFVPEFARLGSNYIAFWYCDKNRNRGVSFEELERRDDSVQIMPQPRIPDDVMSISREAVKIRSPPIHLELTSLSIDKSNKQADMIVNAVKSLNRKPVHTYPPAVLYTTVNLLSKADAVAVVNTLRRKRGVWKVEYRLEQVCDAMPVGIRFEIYADPSMDSAFQIQ